MVDSEESSLSKCGGALWLETCLLGNIGHMKTAIHVSAVTFEV